MDDIVGAISTTTTRALMELFLKLAKERGREHEVFSRNGKMYIEVFETQSDHWPTREPAIVTIPLPARVRGRIVECWADFVDLELTRPVLPSEVEAA